MIFIKWINLDQICVIQIDPKTRLNGFCKITQIWPKHNYIRFIPMKNILGFSYVDKSYQTLSSLYKTIPNTPVETWSQ